MGIRKEDYFTQENKLIKENTWKKELESIRKVPTSLFTIQSAALLILDMQNNFLSPVSHAFIPSSSTIIPPIQTLIKHFSENDRPIFFTKHTNAESFSDPMHNWWHHDIQRDSDAAKISSQLWHFTYPVIEKHAYNAFHNTKMHALLSAAHVLDLVIVGVMSHLCCESTARVGFQLGYRIWVPMDTTASYTEAFHLGTLRALTHGFGYCPVSTELFPNVEPNSSSFPSQSEDN